MTNYSIFDRNVMHALEGAADTDATLDEATTIYMRGRDRDARLSEQAALEWCAIAPLTRFGVSAALDAWREVKGADFGNPDTVKDVMAFIQERQYRRHFPDGRSPTLTEGK